MALFGNSSGGTATSKNLVEFKCGKLNLGEVIRNIFTFGMILFFCSYFVITGFKKWMYLCLKNNGKTKIKNVFFLKSLNTVKGCYDHSFIKVDYF